MTEQPSGFAALGDDAVAHLVMAVGMTAYMEGVSQTVNLIADYLTDPDNDSTDVAGAITRVSEGAKNGLYLTIATEAARRIALDYTRSVAGEEEDTR